MSKKIRGMHDTKIVSFTKTHNNELLVEASEDMENITIKLTFANVLTVNYWLSDFLTDLTQEDIPEKFSKSNLFVNSKSDKKDSYVYYRILDINSDCAFEVVASGVKIQELVNNSWQTVS